MKCPCFKYSHIYLELIWNYNFILGSTKRMKSVIHPRTYFPNCLHWRSCKFWSISHANPRESKVIFCMIYIPIWLRKKALICRSSITEYSVNYYTPKSNNIAARLNRKILKPKFYKNVLYCSWKYIYKTTLKISWNL